MPVERIRAVQRLPIALPEAWAFFSDPRNLARITPPWLRFEVASDLPAAMHPGLIIVYRIRPLPGISMRWVTEITHLVPPRFFVDEQRFGPYRLWHHQHIFREAGEGVEMEDVVHYVLPFGVLGRAAGGRFVRRRLAEIFAYRRRVLEEMFPAPRPRHGDPADAVRRSAHRGRRRSNPENRE